MQLLYGAGDGFLRKLAEDTAGNTLAIAAASLLPLMALIGGGVDVSRTYMAKTQLQSACDSGVLAGRRAMSKTGNYGSSERAKANAMFNFNFDSSQLSVSNVSFVTDDNEDGQVLGTATATVPTVVMKIFKKDYVDLEVECMAELQIGNADIMFVLDVTGSMAGSRITGLRDAVRDFHKTINQAVNDNRTRIRYGFVPYSMTVNVKGLLQSGHIPYDYIADTTPYQSRIALYDSPVYVGTNTNLGTTTEDSYAFGSLSQCRDSNWATGSSSTGTPPNTVMTYNYTYNSWNSGSRRCRRNIQTTRTTYETKYQFNRWRYEQVELHTALFKRFNSVRIGTNATASNSALLNSPQEFNVQELGASGMAGVSTANVTWSGCIEERATLPVSNFNPLPEGVYDLNLDLEPHNDATRWKPLWARVKYSRNTNGSNYFSETTTTNRSPMTEYCPAEMMLLRTVELSDNPDHVPAWLDNYLNALVPVGGTYHDIGLLWGGRLTSPTGLFSDNVNLDADKISVSKHVIFMTDGIMEPAPAHYSAYGIENLDSRITPRGSNLSTVTSRHNTRFLALCDTIKSQGTTIWVVVFESTMTPELQSCATGGRAYSSSNNSELSNAFKFITAQVADLRLGK